MTEKPIKISIEPVRVQAQVPQLKAAKAPRLAPAGEQTTARGANG